jgi:hypothetical protein
MEFEIRVFAGEDRRFGDRVFDSQFGKTLMVAGTAVTMLGATVDPDRRSAVVRFHTANGAAIKQLAGPETLTWVVADMSTGEIREETIPARPVTPEEFLRNLPDRLSSRSTKRPPLTGLP